MTKKIIIDQEFHSLIRPLTKEEYSGLEDKLKNEGCLAKLVVWKGKNILLDGYHRYEICKKHGIPYEVAEMEFATREEAKEWIIENQLKRRNLSACERIFLALELEPTIAKKAKEQQRKSGKEAGRGMKKKVDSKKDRPIDTLKEIAKHAGNVRRTTISKAKFIKEHADKNTIRKLLEDEWKIKRGKKTINSVYWELRKKLEKGKPIKIKPRAAKAKEPEEEVDWDYVIRYRGVIDDMNSVRRRLKGLYNEQRSEDKYNPFFHTYDFTPNKIPIHLYSLIDEEFIKLLDLMDKLDIENDSRI